MHVERWWNRPLGSISSMFYVQLLRSQIPKAEKRYWWLNCIFYTFGIYECKSCALNVDEIDTRLRNADLTFLNSTFCERRKIHHCGLIVDDILDVFCVLRHTQDHLPFLDSFFFADRDIWSTNEWSNLIERKKLIDNKWQSLRIVNNNCITV